VIALHLYEVESINQSNTLISLVPLQHDVGKFGTINTAGDTLASAESVEGGDNRREKLRATPPFSTIFGFDTTAFPSRYYSNLSRDNIDN